MTKKQRYFVKQKLMGLALIIFGVLSSIIIDGDSTGCILLLTLGLFVMFTKDMAIVDDYYWEIEEEDRRR